MLTTCVGKLHQSKFIHTHAQKHLICSQQTTIYTFVSVSIQIANFTWSMSRTLDHINIYLYSSMWKERSGRAKCSILLRPWKPAGNWTAMAATVLGPPPSQPTPEFDWLAAYCTGAISGDILGSCGMICYCAGRLTLYHCNSFCVTETSIIIVIINHNICVEINMLKIIHYSQ